jgi:hypothetical protein
MDIEKIQHLGSYSTTEDITRYISENTILPFILESTAQKCPDAFTPDGYCWRLLQKKPDRYLYDALKQGYTLPLPPDIEIGRDNLARRDAWNKPALEEYALPREIWREVVVRRQRYTEIKNKLHGGQVCSIDELVTHNLNIRQFMQDAILSCESICLLVAFYESIAHVTILDPTCGSGAFLLAALNVLDPLYNACLERMQSLNKRYTDADGELSPVKQDCINRIQEILSQVEQSPNRRYFVYKSILLSNLYGVDLMETATEICKRHLYLKLVSSIERSADLEPFSSMDCHIKTGNALVGRVHASGTGSPEKRSPDENLSFDWFTEFREIMSNGGFDVIIGNPPYVVYSKVKDAYQVENYDTQTCGNLSAYVLERALTLLRPGGRYGMIVPVSAISSESYQPLGRLLLRKQLWVSSYSNRPNKLFASAEQRLAILLMKDAVPPVLLTSAYRHWYNSERAYLFETLSYATGSIWLHTGMPLKSGSARAESIFSQMNSFRGFPLLACQEAKATVWVHNAPTYWVRALPFAPNAGVQIPHSKHYYKVPVGSLDEAFALAAVLSSSTFYFFYKLVSNCRDLGQKELRLFPLGEVQPTLVERLTSLGRLLATRLKETCTKRSRQYRSGPIDYEEYYPAKAKALIDEIDRVLAEHYGFSGEDLDFLLNYDIKYRIGSLHSFP